MIDFLAALRLAWLVSDLRLRIFGPPRVTPADIEELASHWGAMITQGVDCPRT